MAWWFINADYYGRSDRTCQLLYGVQGMFIRYRKWKYRTSSRFIYKRRCNFRAVTDDGLGSFITDENGTERYQTNVWTFLLGTDDSTEFAKSLTNSTTSVTVS